MNTEIMSFLGDVNTPVAFATVDGEMPKVRFFSFKMVDGEDLYFITSKKKRVYSELCKNPHIEICSMPSSEKAWVRLNGKVEFVHDLELNKKAFALLPLLEMAYGDVANPDIVLLKVVDVCALKFDMRGNVTEL